MQVSSKRRRFSPEYREQAAKMVIETSRPIAQVARELGIGEQTLGNWVTKYRQDHADDEPALDLDERAQLEELKRQTREPKMENEFLKECAAYFAQNQQ
jgi:transposase-like protein